MRRIATALLVTAPLLPPATPALGQAAVALTGGANWSSVRVGDRNGVMGSPRALRGSLGLDVAIPLYGRLGIQVGGSYSEKGASFRDRGFLDYKGALELGYLELRVLGKALVLETGDGARLHLLAGPAAATRISCRRSTQFDARNRTSRGRADCRGGSGSPRDWAVIGGAWLDMPISESFGLVLTAFRSWGMHDINQWSERVTIRTRTLSLHGGISYSIG